ncbi:zonular occludens toxin domain-containing protein [Lacrimispora sp.]|uniref:zonular occludens toxin domain-containing protein n=1 Tax=Lacrimispora sp. TaxID=2719234 RepID=UPI0029DFF65A|nr:zona occludens toxin [Lacrimispora sp.]
MIYLYSGTPGSGKSLHVARVIYYTLLRNKPVICNFPINTQKVKRPQKFTFVDNSELNPEMLISYSRQHFDGRPVREGEITLVIDECQMIFNARSWDAKGREAWNKFFTLHRHFGYDIILIAQFDRMIDRQIRSLIEYEQVHRKVTNLGWRGWLLCALMLSPSLFVSVKMWYPMKERIGSEFFKAKKKYYQLYDTYAIFETEKSSAG